MPSPLTHLVFDLDNTLYSPALGIVERVNELITHFMTARLGFDRATAEQLRAQYRDAHGTTLHGLMLHHDVAADEFLAHVHAIELDDVLAPDPALLAMLEADMRTKVVLTNGSATHAERVLARLGIRRCFTEVFSLERVGYVAKPSPAAFTSVLDTLGVPAAACLFLDDRHDNLVAAHQLGGRTLLVGAASLPADSPIDWATLSVLDLPAILFRARGAS